VQDAVGVAGAVGSCSEGLQLLAAVLIVLQQQGYVTLTYILHGAAVILQPADAG
jgi:hypothetical protein